MKKYIFKSQISLFKILLFNFLFFCLLIVIYAFLEFKNLQEDIWILLFIEILIYYFFSLYSISTCYFYKNKMVIKYPTRIINRTISILYSDVFKTKHKRAPKGIMLFIIYFYYKKKMRTVRFDLFGRGKIDLLFSFLSSKEIKIELDIWGQKSVYNNKKRSL